MTANIDHLVHDIITQIRLAINIKQNAFIGVYVARQNLIPVIDKLLEQANLIFFLQATDLKSLKTFIEKHYNIRLDVWQKPEPFDDQRNHLTLTVGGLTAIIFDYTENT